MITLSFIIPIYNNSIKEITRCLESIIKLNNIKYEIILVNDGSSPEYTQKYKRLMKKYGCKYFFQKNSGVSNARNLGIRVSQGDYIIFVDADDVINATSIQSSDFQKKPNIIIYDAEIKYLSTHKSKVYKLHNVNNPIKMKMLFPYLINDGLLNWVFAKAYQREYLVTNNISFDTELITGEDWNFVMDILSQKPKTEYKSSIMYYYLVHRETRYNRATKKPKKMIKSITILFLRRKNFLKMHFVKNYKSIEKNLNERAISGLFGIYIDIVRNKKYDESIKKEFIKSVFAITKNNKNLNVSTHVKIFLMRHNALLLAYLYSWLRKKYHKE